ncbi:Protein transport protein Sec31A [Hordeum vulgare]|nr:Protein transport protein Sec31A [Hordeum vulgare]
MDGHSSVRDNKKEEMYKLMFNAQKERMDWDWERVSKKLQFEREKIEIFKTKWDNVDGGAQVVPDIEDLIPTNHWLNRVHLPGRIATMTHPLVIARRPRIEHEEGAREPLWFHVHIKDEVDIGMLIILPPFRTVM